MTEDRPVCVEFELTPEDWVEVCEAHTRRSSLTRDALKQVRRLFVAICALLAVMQVLTGWTFGAVLWLIGGGVGYAALPQIFSHAQRSQYRKFAKAGVTNGLFGPHRVELREEGVADMTSGYEWLIRWGAIERVEESGGTFMIYSGPNSFVAIPSSAFREPEALREFGDRFFGLMERARGLPGGSEREGLRWPLRQTQRKAPSAERTFPPRRC